MNNSRHNRNLAIDPWGWWREEMPVTRRYAYLDHAAVSPLPQPAADRLQTWAADASEQGVVPWASWVGEVENLRGGVAAFIGARPDEIGLIPNTTFGVNIVAEGFPWKSGDNVVLLGDDFPSNRLPWYQQQAEGVEVREVPSENGRYRVEKVLEHFDHNTKILALSWVGYATGFRIPLDDLVSEARRRGVYVFLDAIQGLGVFPINVQETPVDFLAADGHKWLLGPEGAGVFYCRQELIDVLRCRMVGWNSVIKRFDFSSRDDRLRPEVARWEGGSANLCGFLALGASFRIFEQVVACHGVHAIAERVLENSRQLTEALASMGAEVFSPQEKDQRSGIVIFRVPNEAPAVTRRRCAENQVIVNCRGQGVRASIHAYNDSDDIARLVDTLKG